MYTSTILGEGKCFLFREVSLIRGVLLESFHCTCMYSHAVVCSIEWDWITMTLLHSTLLLVWDILEEITSTMHTSCVCQCPATTGSVCAW